MGAFVFLLVLLTLIAVCVELAYFLSHFSRHGNEGIFVWVLLAIQILTPLGLMVYSTYWSWLWVKNTHFRIAWIDWRASSKAIRGTLEKHGILYDQRPISAWKSFMDRMKEELILNEDGPRILIRGGGNRAWSVVFVAMLRTGDDSGLERIKNLIDEVLPVHRIQ